MILTLCNQKEIRHFDITAEQFFRLRAPDISDEEICFIAEACHIDTNVLVEYISDLKKSTNEIIDIDSSCDYSDHL